METPENPEEAEKSDNLQTIRQSENPGITDESEKSDNVENVELTKETEKSDNLEHVGITGNTENPDKQENVDIPQKPEIPAKPKKPRKPREKIKYRNILSEIDSDVSYDRGDYSDDDKEKQQDSVHTGQQEPNLGPEENFPECIVTREQWGAVKKRKGGRKLKHPVPNVVLTYKTGVPRCEAEEECVKVIQELQRRHMDQGMNDIAFNFLIGGDLRVYEGRGWNLQPEPKFQFPELRGKRLDIGLLGDYSGDEINIGMAVLGIELAHYGVKQEYLEKRYRLVETELFLGFDEYVPGKKEEFPEFAFRIEDWYPGNPMIQERPRSLFEEIGDKEGIWDDYNA